MWSWPSWIQSRQFSSLLVEFLHFCFIGGFLRFAFRHSFCCGLLPVRAVDLVGLLDVLHAHFEVALVRVVVEAATAHNALLVGHHVILLQLRSVRGFLVGVLR